MLTRSEVAEAIDAAQAMREDWLRSEEPKFSDKFEAKLESLYDLCNTRDIEPMAWPLVRKVDEHERIYQEWRVAEQQPGGSRHPEGSPSIYKCWDNKVRKAKDHPKQFNRPEPIPLAIRQGTNVPQIAKTYGWYDASGRPDTQRVHREYENPGSEFDAETWVNPEETKYWEEMRRWHEARQQRVIDSPNGGQSKESEDRKSAPESLDILIRQQTNVPQILKMKPEMTEEAVCQRAAELGVVLDGMVYVNQYQAQQAQARATEAREEAELKQYREDGPATEPAPDDKPLSSKLSSVETYAELGKDINARVIKMAEDGHKAKAISTALTGQSPHPLSPGQVGKILAEYRRKQTGVDEAAEAKS